MQVLPIAAGTVFALEEFVFETWLQTESLVRSSGVGLAGLGVGSKSDPQTRFSFVGISIRDLVPDRSPYSVSLGWRVGVKV